MARKSPGRKPNSKAKPIKRAMLDEAAMTDSDAELDDGFAAGDDRIALQPGAAMESDDDFDEQARYLEQKLKLQQGEDDLDDVEEEEDGQRRQQAQLRDRLWGANKRAYYQTEDAAEGGSDEEAEREEEEEVRRLQQQQVAALADEDFDLPPAAGSGSRQQDEQSLEQLVATGVAGGVEVEAVAKDIASLTQEEQLAVVMSDAPELLSLLEELKSCLDEVRGRIGPLLREVTAGNLATAAGLSYLEAKHLLLLQYCMCIVAYLMLKAEGKSVKDHPVIERLVLLRAYIEKIRPIDKQLAYQIDKLLRATSVAQAAASAEAAAGAVEDSKAVAGGDRGAASSSRGSRAAGAASTGDDALRFRPNPAALIAKAPLIGDEEALGVAGAAGGAAGVYKPPKLNPVAMEEDRAISNKELRRIREAQRKAQRSSVLREMAQELAGAPDEVTPDVPGMDSAAAVATRQRLEARAAAEEDLMLRVPLSKHEAKQLKAQRRAGLSGAGLTDFADDVADLVAAADGKGSSSGLAAAFGKQRLSQQYGADLASQQARMRSGDEDLVPRKPLHERRAVFDAVAARRVAASGSDGELPEEDFGGAGGSRGHMSSKRRQQEQFGEEDEFYTASKAARSQVKAAKKAKHAAPQLAPPLPDQEAVGQRKISYEIEKNRGLTPHRRKDLKNPRKKHRVKFAQAVVRRKGQVQGVRQAPSAPRGYAGETTGIKAKVAKSVRLG
eukprot:gene5267-5502_t